MKWNNRILKKKYTFAIGKGEPLANGLNDTIIQSVAIHYDS